MKSSSPRKAPSPSPVPSKPSAGAATPRSSPEWARRAASRLRALEHRLVQIDEAMGADEWSDALVQLDAVRSRMEETAEASAATAAPEADPAGIEDAVKRLTWAVQALEACREVDADFSARLDEVSARLDGVIRALAPGREG